jgi:hypothetical protein
MSTMKRDNNVFDGQDVQFIEKESKKAAPQIFYDRLICISSCWVPRHS